MKEYDVIIIGAGLAGASLAPEIAATGYNVLLIDEGKELIGTQSSSYCQSYRIHNGSHYIKDLPTAKKCLEESIKFVKKYPHFTIGYKTNEKILQTYPGRSVIMSNSEFPPNDAINAFQELKKHYDTLVSESKENKIYGDPNNFIKYLITNECPEIAKDIPFFSKDDKVISISPAMIVEIPEFLIDIQKCRSNLESSFLKFHGQLMLNQKVIEITFLPDDLKYLVTTIDVYNGEKNIYKTKAIVNCSWQEIELLGKKLESYTTFEKLVRIKASLLIELPLQLRNISNYIFGIGNYATLTNLSNGYAVVTFEEATQIGEYIITAEYQKASLTLESGARKITYNKNGCIQLEFKEKEIVDKIWKGIIRYFPALAAASPKELRIGYVKTINGMCNHKRISPDGTVHGIQQQGLCYIDLHGMKATFAVNAAEQCLKKLNTNIAFRKYLLCQLYALKNKDKKYERSETPSDCQFLISQGIFCSKFKNQKINSVIDILEPSIPNVDNLKAKL
jgi:hypothetical protein